MSRSHRRLAAVLAASVASLLAAGAASAHPLGNATVSRAVSVEVEVNRIGVVAAVDMAEIPAFSSIQAIDLDDDGVTDADERDAWAAARCAEIGGGLGVRWDGRPVAPSVSAPPTLSFPPGVGGLETLRLECSFSVDVVADDGASHRVEITDATDDGRPGWREVTVRAAAGMAIVEADVPAVSPSASLTSYPPDRLDAPLDVRAGSAVVAPAAPGAATVAGEGPVEGAPSTSDPLVALLEGTARGGGALGVVLALMLSVGLGAAHGLSPGHGKALVAASLIGSRGTPRQAIWLALAVGASHTGGVLLLGGVVLVAGALLAPDLVLAWLSLAAGACVVGVGATMVVRAIGRDHRGPSANAHGHGPDDEHGHAHPHPHPHEGLQARSLVALGLFGGLVPSTSALIVLLLAVTTGQVLLGLALILAFGAGMAVALGAVALASVVVGRRMTAARPASRPILVRLAGAVPAVSGATVLVAGAAMTIGALGRVL